MVSFKNIPHFLLERGLKSSNFLGGAKIYGMASSDINFFRFKIGFFINVLI